MNGTLDFGSTPIGQPTVQYYKISQPLTTLNTSAGGPFLVALVEDTGAGHGALPASAFGRTLSSACHNCYLAVEFLPTAAGPQTGTLTLTTAAAGNTLTLAHTPT